MVKVTRVLVRLRALRSRRCRRDPLRMSRQRDETQIASWENEGGTVRHERPPPERCAPKV